MSEVKHTAGPWVAERTLAPRGWIVSRKDGQYDVAIVRDGSGQPENEANARLIAAAPDLLAMLKVAQLWLDIDGRYDMQGINAAISKAKGKTVE